MARFDVGCNCDECCAEREYETYEGEMLTQAHRAIARSVHGVIGKRAKTARVDLDTLSVAIVDELKIACGMEDDIGTTDPEANRQNAPSSFMLH